MKIHSRKPRNWLINCICLLFFLGRCYALDAYSRFRVEEGTGPVTAAGTFGYGGTCYGVGEEGADLDAIYTEAIDMAQVALDALNNYANSATVRATVQTFLGIKPASETSTTVLADHANYFTTAKS